MSARRAACAWPRVSGGRGAAESPGAYCLRSRVRRAAQRPIGQRTSSRSLRLRSTPASMPARAAQGLMPGLVARSTGGAVDGVLSGARGAAVLAQPGQVSVRAVPDCEAPPRRRRQPCLDDEVGFAA